MIFKQNTVFKSQSGFALLAAGSLLLSIKHVYKDPIITNKYGYIYFIKYIL